MSIPNFKHSSKDLYLSVHKSHIVGLLCSRNPLLISAFLCFFKHTFSLTFPFFSSAYRLPLKSNVEKMMPVLPNLSLKATQCTYIWQTQHGKCNSIWLRSKKCSLSPRTPTLVVAKGNYFNLFVKLSNHGDDSYNTSLSIQHPAGLSFSWMNLTGVTLNFKLRYHVLLRVTFYLSTCLLKWHTTEFIHQSMFTVTTGYVKRFYYAFCGNCMRSHTWSQMISLESGSVGLRTTIVRMIEIWCVELERSLQLCLSY